MGVRPRRQPMPGTGKPTTFNYPAPTVETRTNAMVTVNWINGLVDPAGNFLPPLTPVDQTIHWASPMGMPAAGKMGDPAPYKGPVPIVTHLHGAHTGPESDGYPMAWFLPDAKNIPAGYMTRGANFTSTGKEQAGAAKYAYPNTQPATTLWYHDHALGMTRNNVYSGLAGFWLIRDDTEDGLGLPGPAPKLGDKKGTAYYEIPLAIQDLPSIPTVPCSIPKAGNSSTSIKAPTFPIQTCRRSGTRNFSETRCL